MRGGEHFLCTCFLSLDIHKFTNDRDAGHKIAALAPGRPRCRVDELGRQFPSLHLHGHFLVSWSTRTEAIKGMIVLATHLHGNSPLGVDWTAHSTLALSKLWPRGVSGPDGVISIVASGAEDLGHLPLIGWLRSGLRQQHS